MRLLNIFLTQSSAYVAAYLQLQLQKAQKDYGGLLEQLQIQREAAAGSLNKLQQKSKEQITELQMKIESLITELQGVRTACIRLTNNNVLQILL